MVIKGSVADAAREANGFVPLDPAKRAPLHWTHERRRAARRSLASLVIAVLFALAIGFVAGQLLPQVL